MRVLIWLLLPILAGCVSIPVKNDPLELTIDKSFDDSWAKIVRVLTIDNDLPIRVIEKESGIITTDWVQYERPANGLKETLDILASVTPSNTGQIIIRFNLKIFIQSSGSKTNVIINDHVEKLGGSGWISTDERPVALQKIKEDIEKINL